MKGWTWSRNGGKKFLKLWLAAALVFTVADLVFSWNPAAAAPYLEHRYEMVFRRSPALDFGPWAEALNGLIAAAAFLALRKAWNGGPIKDGFLFGSILWGFWVVSGTQTAFIWLDVPVSMAWSHVLWGVPKCLAIGYGIRRAAEAIDRSR